jgi:endothelin-converting enzyme/putative endopeptidase
MTRSKRHYTLAAVLGAAAGLNLAAAVWAEPPPATDASRVEPTVRPGDDFYAYANGDWLKATALPAGQSAYGSGAMLRALNARRVAEIVHAAARPTPQRPRLQQQIGDYYASLLDTGAMDAKGMAPLAADLRRIRDVHDRRALSRYLGGATRVGDAGGGPPDSVLGVWAHQGFSQPDRYLPHIQQGGLGLASREAYLEAAADQAALRARYQAHIAAMLRGLGLSDPQARARRVLALETALARSHATDADTADAVKANNLWRRRDFAARAPGMDWASFLRAAGLDGQDSFVVWQPGAVSGAAQLVAHAPLQAWKDYLTFHLLEHYAAVLPKPYRELYLGYGGKDPADGAQAEARAIEMTQACLGEPIGQMYVERYFPPSAKAAAQAMVDNIRTAFRAHLAQVAWMAPETRAKAIAKLDALEVGLGYPDHWIDFSGLEVVRGDAIGNLRRAEAFQYRHELAKLKQPVDAGEWSITPQSVSAVINFSPNALQFSAGLLQPPYFDPDGDAASNYGSAGAGISHEINHSFDELGNIYDAEGRLQASWWTDDDRARFRAAAAPLIAQFSAYCPQADLCVRGEQTLGENVNDLTGLKIAHDAYLLSLKGRPDVIKDGLTGEQRFFLAFARRWRMLQTADALRRQVLTDIHTPGVYRSDTVRNLDAWYSAFDVKPTDRLYLRPEDRVQVW